MADNSSSTPESNALHSALHKACSSQVVLDSGVSEQYGQVLILKTGVRVPLGVSHEAPVTPVPCLDASRCQSVAPTTTYVIA